MRQDIGGTLGVMVGDVKQAQTRLGRVTRQGHLGAKLGNDQARRHAPLRMGGVAEGEQIHSGLNSRLGGRLAGRLTWFFGTRASRFGGSGLGRCGLGFMSCLGFVLHGLCRHIFDGRSGNVLELLRKGSPPLHGVDSGTILFRFGIGC